jgi:hypothetical protein
MGLAQKLADYAKEKSAYCPFGAIIEKLPKEDKAALEQAIAQNLPARVIVHALREEGHKSSADSYWNHVKGQCRCPKSE